MLDRRSAVRRFALVPLGAAVALTALTLRAPGHRPPAEVAAAPPPLAEMPDTLDWEVRYAGMGAEGVDMIWRGRVEGVVPGQVTIRMEYAGSLRGRDDEVWPVNAWLFFSADDYRNSFAAELSGRMNWTTGEMRVTGLVSDGARKDTPVEHAMRVVQPALGGRATVHFFPVNRMAVGLSRRQS